MLAGMNQLWRRNIRKADKAGVEVTTSAGRGDEEGDLKAFHDLYVHTAERDHFTPRPLAYFQTMYDALGAEDPDRITPLARPPRGRPRRRHDRGPRRRATRGTPTAPPRPRSATSAAPTPCSGR